MSPKRRRIRENKRKETSSSIATVLGYDPNSNSPAARYAAYRKATRDFPQLGKFTEGLDFLLDDFQFDGCTALEKGQSVLVAAPTAAGKTVVGEFAIELALSQGKRVFYTTPIKALSNQKFNDFRRRYGDARVGLLTGDTSVNRDSDIVVMTTEVLRNMLYRSSAALEDLGYVILDEVHYLADRFRGPVWEEVIIHLPLPVRLVCLSATVSNAEEFGEWLREVRGSCAVIVSEERPVPLLQHMLVGTKLFDLYQIKNSDNRVINPELIATVRRSERTGGHFGNRHTRRSNRFTLSKDTPVKAKPLSRISRASMVRRLQQRGLLPAIVFIFSRAACEGAVGQLLASGVCLTSAAEEERIERRVQDAVGSLAAEEYIALGVERWREGLRCGIGAHHAGLLPVMKECVEELFCDGLIKIIYATETLSLGINMPARSVVIEELSKFNGASRVALTPGEYTQLTGRAGRRGVDDQGHAVVIHSTGVSPEQVAALASKRTYPLRSAFHPTYNMAVNLLDHLGASQVRQVLETSFAQFQADRAVVGLARKLRALNEDVLTAKSMVNCSHGDIVEFTKLRDDLSQLQKHSKRERGLARRSKVIADMKALRRGTVIAYRLARHNYVSAVLRTKIGGADTTWMEVIQDDGRFKRITPSDLSGGFNIAGKITIDRQISGRKPRDRAHIATGLERFEDAKKGISHNRAEYNDQVAQQVAYIREQLRSHGCTDCPNREENARHAGTYLKLQRSYDELAAQIRTRTSNIAIQFDQVLQVLRDLGYLGTEGVKAGGEVLRGIYCERDLIVAGCLNQDLWEGLDEAQLAAVVSTCVFEPRPDHRSDRRIPGGNGGLLAKALADTFAVAKKVSQAETEAQLPVSAVVETGIVHAIYDWTSGAELGVVLDMGGLSGGDFVRNCKQVIDLLNQIALTTSKPVGAVALRAVTKMRRGVVAWSGI